MLSIFLSPAAANLVIHAELFATSGGECRGGSIVKLSVDVDVCKLVPDHCEYFDSCGDLEAIMKDLEKSMEAPKEGEEGATASSFEIPTFGECYPLDGLMGMLGGGEESSDSSSSENDRRREALEALMESSSMSSNPFGDIAAGGMPFGDMRITCGGGGQSAMSAGAAVGMTFLITVVLIAAIVGGCFMYSGMKLVKPENQDNSVELGETSAAQTGRISKQWQETAGDEGEDTQAV